MADWGAIQVRGARENNLRDVDLDIPKRRFTVFTGVSGSGKSSLVFETIAAEAGVVHAGGWAVREAGIGDVVGDRAVAAEAVLAQTCLDLIVLRDLTRLRLDDALLLVRAQPRVQRQAQQALADVFRDGAVALATVEAPADVR